MSIISELRLLKPRDYALAFIAYISTVAPGCLILYWFRPSILANYDVFKVCILSLAITLPVMFTNIALIGVPPIPRFRTPTSHFDALFGGALSTFIALYLSLFVAYIFGFGFKIFALTTAIVDIVVLYEMIPIIHDEKTYQHGTAKSQ